MIVCEKEEVGERKMHNPTMQTMHMNISTHVITFQCRYMDLPWRIIMYLTSIQIGVASDGHLCQKLCPEIKKGLI